MPEPKKFLPIFLRSLEQEFPSTIGGSAIFPETKNLNLFIEGGFISSNDSLNLFLQNDGVSNDLDLFIQGSTPWGTSTCSGCIPSYDTLHLFIGQNNLVNDNVKLFLKVVDGNPSGSVDLFMKGIVNPTGGLNLVIPNIIASKNKNIKLFISGF